MDSHTIKVACSSCNLRELCLPMGLNADEMVKLDYLYVTHWSIWSDVKILLRTVAHVVSRRGM